MTNNDADNIYRRFYFHKFYHWTDLKKTLLLLFIFLPICLTAQQHPLAVESSALLDPGLAQLDLGLSYFRNQPYPLSGLKGHLLKFGNLYFAVSLSEYVELQTEGTVLNLLDVTKRDSAFNSKRTTRSNPTGDIGDFTVWTKFGLLNEYRFGLGLSVRFGVQLPNASNESGLGVDEMNFYSSLLLEKHIGGKWTFNVGLGILSDPTVLGQQHDVFIYGIQYYLPIAEKTSIFAESSGRKGHAGIGIPHLAGSKIGIEQTFGDVTATLSGMFNHSPNDYAKGVELSFSYLLRIVDVKK